MSNLIVIDGTSGIWKDDLVGYINDVLIDSTLIIKDTTRNKRESDLRLDLQFLKNGDFDLSNYEYYYKYNNEYYGFSKIELEKAMVKYRNIFLIVRNVDVIRHLSNDFANVNIIKVFVYTDAQKISKRMNVKNGSSLSKSINQSLDDYLRNPEIYDLVLINGAAKNDFYRLINYAIEFADIKSKQKKVLNLTGNAKVVLNIILPILDALLAGLAINSITGNSLSQWNIICFALSVLHILWLIVVQYIINK